MINEHNFKQTLFDYAFDKYGLRFEEFFNSFRKEFPYDYDGLSDDLYFKNFIDWLMIEKPLPDTHKTIIEEYVEEHPVIEEQLKSKLLSMKNVVRSEFVVISKKCLELKLKDRKTNITYHVVLYKNNPDVSANCLLTGRLHPFGEKCLFAGVFLISRSPMIFDADVIRDMYLNSLVKDIENTLVSQNTKLSTILSKYPIQWIDGMCINYEIEGVRIKDQKIQSIVLHILSNINSIISKLTEESRKAASKIIASGGIAKYIILKEFDDHMSFFWIDSPPSSTIGLLRLQEIIHVGRMQINGRMHRVAFIPKDIRENVAEALAHYVKV